MKSLIDFSNPNSFPQSLKEWGKEFEKMICRTVNLADGSEWWKIEHQLRELHIEESNLVKDFVAMNLDIEVVLYHCARILNEQQYWSQGIVIDGGANSIGEKRLKDLLCSIGLTMKQIEEILTHVFYLWNRDDFSRTKAVHFFIDEAEAYKDDKLNHFAINLGGEILRWSLEAIDRDIYKTEPYKRLWIMGTPSIVKFKSKLENVHELYRHSLIAEIVKYFIVTGIYDHRYEFEFTGMTNGSVLPKDILCITEIKNFIQMQEKYPDYKGFYDEIK